MANQSYVFGSGVTSIEGVNSFEVGNTYSQYDIVFFSGYSESNTEYFPDVTGHYYYTGTSSQVSSSSNSPATNGSNWTQKLFADASYGSMISYQNMSYDITFGDGYYNVQSKSENSLQTKFDVTFNKRTDKQTRALVHLLEDSFNKGEKPSGAYTGIYWTPFVPYNQEHEFYIQEFDRSFDYPNVNNISFTLYREDQSTIDWQEYFIPFNQTRGFFEEGATYSLHDIVYLSGDYTDDEGNFTQNGLYKVQQSGWYYYTGATETTATADNGPIGDNSLWTNNEFYFDLNQGLSIKQAPRYIKHAVQNEYFIRAKDGLNINLLNMTFTLQGRTDKEAKAIVHFLEHKKGSKQFNFTPPRPYNKKDLAFFCPKWSHKLNFKENNDVEVNFIQFPINLSADTVSFTTLVTIDPYFRGSNQTQGL